jgi:DNA adenine methylase
MVCYTAFVEHLTNEQPTLFTNALIGHEAACLLPKKLLTPKAPPIKCQGIKTKLVPFIAQSIQWQGKGVWLEPFLGSGTVLFNIKPERALVSDTNIHIIRFYQNIQSKAITPEKVRRFLVQEGQQLSKKGEEHYYYIRDRFNAEGDSFDFLFLSRSCFNGVMRFNKKGQFNVPFCRKPERFRPPLITKIVNQVFWVSEIIKSKDWSFEVLSWRDALTRARHEDFIYADPPYTGRHNDYYNQWSDEDARELVEFLSNQSATFALSTWKENRYRSNALLSYLPKALVVKSNKHFYHVGSSEAYRNEMEEALILSI